MYFTINDEAHPYHIKSKMNFPIFLNNGKNPKWKYYLENYLKLLLPDIYYKKKAKRLLRSFNDRNDREYIQDRVDFYNKLAEPVEIKDAIAIKDLHLKDVKQKVYFFDAYPILRSFPKHYKFSRAFGDVVHVPASPSIVKSRPVADDNQNSVLLKLNKVRHFVRIKKDIPFSEKKDKLVFRGKVTYKEKRRKFFEMYFDHPMCDLGDTQKKKINPDEWKVNKTSIHYLLQYKFILAVEGIDVASNLKWVMSSNSLAVMPKPEFETWFMESRLIPDHHYVAIKPDYSDLEEKLKYYIEHQDEAQSIIKNAQEYVNQFWDKEREHLISLLVMQKYFRITK